jgi:hypothetical protein
MDWQELGRFALCMIGGGIIAVPLSLWIVEAQDRRQARIRRTPPPTAILDELHQTSKWWDREFEALNRAAFPPKPFNPAEHEGHNLIEVMTFGGSVVHRSCNDCIGGQR